MSGSSPTAKPAKASRDGQLSCLVAGPNAMRPRSDAGIVQRANISVTPCEGAARWLVAEIEISVGAILMTDAAFTDPHIDHLLAALSL